MRSEKVNHAVGEAESMTLKAQARATAIQKIADAINQNVSNQISYYSIVKH